jgi:hypothetical protein
MRWPMEEGEAALTLREELCVFAYPPAEVLVRAEFFYIVFRRLRPYHRLHIFAYRVSKLSGYVHALSPVAKA